MSENRNKKRFASISEEDLEELVNSKDSASTKRSVKRGVKLFRDFLTENGKSGDFEALTNP